MTHGYDWDPLLQAMEAEEDWAAAREGDVGRPSLLPPWICATSVRMPSAPAGSNALTSATEEE